MDIKTIVVGSLQENCYIVTKNNKTLIIDPGDEADRIINVCKDLDVVEVIITHHHFDHIGALKEVEKYFHIKEGVRSKYFNYDIIATPGHTRDSISLYFPEDLVLFSGDFIFYHSIGRTDLPGGSDTDMINSLKIISEYPDGLVIYPGHGKMTTLKEERKRFNMYY